MSGLWSWARPGATEQSATRQAVTPAAASTPNAAAEAEIEQLIGDLREAARQAGMQRDDPLMPLLTAFARAIRAMHTRTTDSDRVVVDASTRIVDALQLARQSTDAETALFRSRLAATEADTVRRVSHAIAASADAALARRVRVCDRNTAVLAALLLVVTAAACLGGGYRWGNSTASDTIQQTEWRLQAAFAHGGVGASLWALLMEANDITAAIKQCHGANLIQTGTARSACSVPLWTSLPDQPPPQGQLELSETPIVVAPVSPKTAAAAPAPSETDTIPLFAFPRPPTGPIHFGPKGSR